MVFTSSSLSSNSKYNWLKAPFLIQEIKSFSYIDVWDEWQAKSFV